MSITGAQFKELHPEQMYHITNDFKPNGLMKNDRWPFIIGNKHIINNSWIHMGQHIVPVIIPNDAIFTFGWSDDLQGVYRICSNKIIVGGAKL